MFQHKNTIRYRIKNLEKIIKAENGDFYEQLSIAIRSEKLIILIRNSSKFTTIL